MFNSLQEVKLLFPGAQRMNRGNHEIPSLVHACKANNVTDLVIIQETRGRPGMKSLLQLLCFSGTKWHSLDALSLVVNTRASKETLVQLKYSNYHESIIQVFCLLHCCVTRVLVQYQDSWKCEALWVSQIKCSGKCNIVFVIYSDDNRDLQPCSQMSCACKK